MKYLMAAIVSVAIVEPAAAHHVIGGMMPVTYLQGFLSGLGHPIIGLDHFAAMVVVGCLAAWQTRGPQRVIAYMLAMIAGAALHVGGASIAGAEILVALSVLVLGAALLRPIFGSTTLLALFVAVGFINGYALGESITGAEPAPLYAYFLGLVVIQTTVALAALGMTRALAGEMHGSRVRLVGALAIGIGLAALAKEILLGL